MESTATSAVGRHPIFGKQTGIVVRLESPGITTVFVIFGQRGSPTIRIRK
jgi:hypothetical protein